MVVETVALFKDQGAAVAIGLIDVSTLELKRCVCGQASIPSSLARATCWVSQIRRKLHK